MSGSVVLRIACSRSGWGKDCEALYPPLTATIMVVVIILLSAPASAQQSRAKTEQTACLARAPVAGINTSRLSGKSLERWCLIERQMRAVNGAGQPRYPLLAYLMEWAETSGHQIFIELPETKSFSATAGSFHIERFDPCGIKQTVVISLYLAAIDRAYVGPAAKSADGFIPFTGLKEEDRYAEVFGHELAHAYHILSDFELTQKVEMLVQQTNKQFLAFRTRFRYLPLDPELKRQMAEKDAFLEELETPAMTFEKIVWRELRAADKSRAN